MYVQIQQKKKEIERPAPVQQVYSSGTTELKTLDSKDLRIQKDGDFSLKLKSREEAFNSLNSQDYCGYTFMPLGRDERKRKV